MLREIVEEVVAGQPDMELVGDGLDGGALADAAREHDAAFVVVGVSEADHAAIEALLAARPATKVLALGEEGRRAELYELLPHREPLGEASPQRLIEVIRAHAQEERP